MNKKIVIISSICVAVLLVALSAVAFVFFKDESASKVSAEDVYRQSRYALVSAVPTDALGVAHAGNLGELLEYVCSPSAVTSRYINRTVHKEFFALCDALYAGESGLKGKEAVVTFDFNGRVVPLLVVDLARTGAKGAHTEEVAALQAEYPSLTVATVDVVRESAHLKGRTLLYVSPEKYFVDDAIRTVEEGADITLATGFVKAALDCPSSDYLIVANKALGKFVKNNIEGRFNFAVDYVKKYATWTTLCPSGHNSYSLSYSFAKGKTEYMSIFNNMTEGPVEVSAVIPSTADFVVSVETADIEAFTKAYKDWFDYNGSIIDYKRRQNDFIRSDRNSKHYSADFIAQSLEVKSVSLVQIPKAKVAVVSIGKLSENILLPGESTSIHSGTIYPFAYRDLATVLCGKLFSLTDRSDYKITVNPADFHFTLIGSNLIISDKSNLKRFLAELNSEGSFFSAYSASIPKVESALYTVIRRNPKGDVLVLEGHKARKHSQKATLTVYANPVKGEVAAGGIEVKESDIKAPAAVPSVAPVAKAEAVEEPAAVPQPAAPVAVEEQKPAAVEQQPAATKEQEQAHAATSIKVPAGPYKVKVAGGKTVTFKQPSSKKVTFIDEKGAAKWTAAVAGPICGRVEAVDYFKNGKQQFLFIAGGKLYLIDRVGRMVQGFPKQLKESVVLGPAVYDFNGQKRYNIMVVTANNTIEMYNLDGVKPSSWKGIAGGSKKIAGLPTRKVVGGKTQWVVKFTDGTSKTYGFSGGNAL